MERTPTHDYLISFDLYAGTENRVKAIREYWNIKATIYLDDLLLHQI
jgi:hypothetical protein